MNDMSYRLNSSSNREREWNEVAGEWDDLAREYNQKLYQHYHDHLWLPQVTLTNKQIKILDFGCGTGLFIEKLVHYYQNRFVDDDLPVDTDIPRVHIIGVDTATSMIQTLKEKIRNYDWNDNERHITVTALVADVSTWEEDHRHDEFHNWYGHVDLIVANSVMSYLPTTTPLNDNSEVSPLESTIQIFTKLLKPNDGYFIHADWTDFSLPSPLLTTDTTLSYFKDTTTTTAHQNRDVSRVPLRHTNNGVMNYSAAQWLYINLINNYEFDMDTVETKVFPNVYHHYNRDTSDHHESDTDSIGSRILVGRARRKSLPTNFDLDQFSTGGASH